MSSCNKASLSNLLATPTHRASSVSCSSDSGYSSHSTPASTSSSASSSPSSFKHSSLVLPSSLPRPNKASVDFAKLHLDGELSDVPVDYVLAQLKSQSESLKAMAHYRIDTPKDLAQPLPSHLLVQLPEVCSSQQTIAPTHILSVRFNDHHGRSLLLPVHGLLYAAASPLFAPCSKTDNKTMRFANNVTNLPVVSIQAPNSSTFHLLHAALCGDASSIFTQLLPTLPPVSGRHSFDKLLQPTPESTAARYATLPLAELMAKVDLLHGLWLNVIALQITAQEVWEVLQSAYAVIFSSLKAKFQEKKG